MQVIFRWSTKPIVLLFISAFLFSIFVHATYIPDRTVFEFTSYKDILQFLGVLLILVLVVYLSRKLSYRIGLIISLFIVIISQCTFILLYPLLPFSDMGRLYDIAIHFQEGAFYHSFDKANYLGLFPNNSYYTLLLSAIFLVFPHHIIVAKLLNVLSCIVVIYCTGRIYEELFGRKYVSGIFLILSLFPPFILYANHIYNDMVSLALFTSAVLFLILGLKKQFISYIFFTLVLLVMADLLRQIGFVFFIMMILTLFIFGRNIFSRGLLFTSITLTIFSYFLIRPILNDLLVLINVLPAHYGDHKYPPTAWIHIGLDLQSTGFQNGGRSFNMFPQYDYNSKAASHAYLTDLWNQITNNSVLTYLKFFLKKIYWTWTEGTYQMERYGYGTSIQYRTVLTDKISSSHMKATLNIISHYANSCFLLFASIAVYLAKKQNITKSLIMLLLILGILAFYSIWEIKSRYLIVIFPYLFIYFYYGLNYCIDKFLAIRQNSAK